MTGTQDLNLTDEQAALLIMRYAEYADMDKWYANRGREVRTAELALQGWRPVKTEICDGIYNDDLQMGFGVCMRVQPSLAAAGRSLETGQIYRLGPAHDAQNLRAVEWDALTAMVLYKLLIRLERT